MSILLIQYNLLKRSSFPPCSAMLSLPWIKYPYMCDLLWALDSVLLIRLSILAVTPFHLSYCGIWVLLSKSVNPPALLGIWLVSLMGKPGGQVKWYSSGMRITHLKWWKLTLLHADSCWVLYTHHVSYSLRSLSSKDGCYWKRSLKVQLP